MRNVSALFVLVLSVTTWPALACTKWGGGPASEKGHVTGTGDVVKRTITVADFHGIELEGAMDLELTPSEERSIVVEAQANIADLVSTEVKNGVWHLTTTQGYTTNKTFIVRVSLPAIDMLAIEGSGDVKSTGTFHVNEFALSIGGSGDVTMDLEGQGVTVSSAGSGDVKLGGSCKKLQVTVAGSGDVNAKTLQSAEAAVSVAGSGDVAVNTSEELDASIAGSGSISYVGSPAHVRKDISGSGEVRSIGGTSRKGPL